MLAERCWKAALELNPKYGFARDQLDKLGSGDFDGIIAVGTTAKTMDSLDDWQKRPGLLTPEIVDNWSEEAVLRKLKAIGIRVDRTGFLEQSRKATSIDDLERSLCRSQLKDGHLENVDDDDFIWLAVRRLWRLYCPGEPSEDLLEDLIDEAIPKCERAVSGSKGLDFRPDPVTGAIVQRILDLLMSPKPGLLEHWSSATKCITESRDSLADLLCIAVRWADWNEKVLNAAARLRERTDWPGWRLIEVSSLVHDKDPSWHAVYKEMCAGAPYDCHLRLEAAFLLEDIGEDEAADDCLWDALDTVDLRAKNEIWDLDSPMTTIYEDYQDVLGRIEDALATSMVPARLQDRFERKVVEVEAKKDRYSFSPRLEEMTKRMMESLKTAEEEAATKNPSMRYYEHLSKFNIYFGTPGPVETKLSPMRVGKKNIFPLRKRAGGKKPGTVGVRPRRKGPCPCGSGRMYKNCCGSKH